MSRMNSRRRKKIYRYLAEKFGEICANCHTPSSERQLVVDHKNNDNSDKNLENYQLLCRRCNYMKNPRKGPVDIVCMSVSEERSMTPEMKENRRMEPLFRQWFYGEMLARKKLRSDDAVNTGAEITNASTETIKRYLRKMTSRAGMYVVIKDPQGFDYIHFREQY